jgi:alkanesulfonate monooxygenase SsuD/methylene tetrahydromethanopterin reductase-like flavin-dependent oxidoreductase (luciferase family)
MDYGRPLRFGVFLIPNAAEASTVLAQATVADGLGLELIGIQDHPYQQQYLDAWTLITTIAAQTKRVRVFPDVANLPLRPPALLAKAAASLDLLSGGRVELGLGSGAFWDGIAAMGGPKREPRDAVSALEEAIQVIRLMWSGQQAVSFDGRFYSLRGVHPGPVPAHQIGIWIGALGPRMLSITGRLADGWVPSSSYVPPEKLPEMQARIDESAARAGRKPSAIARIYNVAGTITDGASAGFLEGPVAQWIDQLCWLVLEHGMDSFVFWPARSDGSQLRRFAEEVVPKVRDEVARRRTGADSRIAL